MEKKENTIVLALLRLFFALEWTKKWFKASFETYIRGGLICQNLNSLINENFETAQK